MIKRVFLFLYSVLIVVTSSSAQKSLSSFDVRNFETGDYRASSLNYSGVLGDDRKIYFANENGLLRYDGSTWDVFQLDDYKACFSVLQRGDTIYVGSLNEMGYFVMKNERYQYQSLRYLINPPIQFDAVWQTLEYNDNIYFVSYEGIFRFDGKSMYPINIKNGHVFQVGEDLMVSVIGGGLYQIKGDSSKLVNSAKTGDYDVAYDFLPTPIKDEYYLLTSENGVFTYNSNTFEIAAHQTPIDDILKTDMIYDATIFRDSLIAISTWHGGLLITDRDLNLLQRIHADNGLNTGQLKEVWVDSRSNLWCTSGFGISQVFWNTNPPMLSFTPKTEITSKQVSNEGEKIKNIRFKFATPGFDKSELKYAYYLSGFESEFSDWTNEINKEYTNLDGGTYTFKVKTLLPDSTETAPVTASFNIPIPWYEQSWFTFVVVIGGLGIIFIGYRLRTAQLKVRNQRLEKLVESRTQQLLRQKEQLKLTNSELKTINSELDNFVYRSSHDLVAPLKSLKGLIHIAKMDASDDRMGIYFNKMNTSIQKLEEFIKSIMEYSTNSKSEIIIEEVKLEDLIQNVIEDLQFYENAEKIQLIKKYDTDFTISTDIKRLNIIISNLVTNCIKYHNYEQDKPFIEIVAKKNKKGYSISIRDNGAGIDNIHLDKIFNMFYRASEQGEGSGLGLYIVKETLAIMGGFIEVESKPNTGTAFTVHFHHNAPVKRPVMLDN